MLDTLWINGDGLLSMTLAANDRHPKRERVVCCAAIRRELIWDTHKQANAGRGPASVCQTATLVVLA